MELAELLDKCKKFKLPYSWEFDAWDTQIILWVTVNKKKYGNLVFPKNKNSVWDYIPKSERKPGMGLAKMLVDFSKIDSKSHCYEEYRLDKYGIKVKVKGEPLSNIFRKMQIEGILNTIPTFKMPRKGYQKLISHLNEYDFTKNRFNELKIYWESMPKISLLKSYTDIYHKNEDLFDAEFRKRGFVYPDIREESDKDYHILYDNYYYAKQKLITIEKFINLKKICAKMGIDDWYRRNHSDNDFENIKNMAEYNLKSIREFLSWSKEFDKDFDKLVSEVETSLKANMQLTECEFLKK